MASSIYLQMLPHVFLALCLIYEVSSNTDAVYRLQDSNGARLPNNSIIAPSTLTDERGISCCGSTFGNWFYPNGTAVGSGVPRTVLYVVKREMCSELLVEIGSQLSHITEQDEGVYMCHATDSIGSIRSLFAGIYRPVSHDSSVGPVLPSMDPITLQILSNLTHYPPSFSLNCTSISFPPTQLSWLLDGMDVETLISESSTSQQIRNKLTTTYDNILTIPNFTQTGRMVFTCRVGNTRGSQSANLTVLAPSGPPTNVSTSTPGDSNVIIRWTPSDNTLGYRVFFVSDGVTSNMTIDDPTADSATLTELTSGVEYTISVQAFADLPSQISETVSITLVALAAPTILFISPVSPTSITVTWSPPPSQVQTISGYRISYSPFNNECPQIESARQLVEGGTTTEHTLTGLQEGVEYAVTVQARGVQAFGEASVSMRESTVNAVPSAPPSNVTAVPRSSPEPEIAVSWSLPPCEHVNSADGITGYVVRYRPQNNGDWTSIVVNSATRTTTIEENIVMLVMYEIQVAASNEVGMGPYSLSETASVAAIAPGIVTSLTGRPDIISITVSWDPPVNGEGRGHISKYRFCHKPVSSSFNTCVMLKGEEMQSYRIRSLQPDNPYSVTVRAFIEDLEGPMQELTQTTLAISKVEGVRVRMVGESSVNVTWEKLNSLDVSGYQISYSSGGSRRKRQDNTLSVGDVNSAVVSSLQSGVTYNFRVSAVVLVNNLSRAGPLSDITTESSFSVPVSSGVVAGVVVVLLSLLVVVVVIVIIAAVYYVWRKGRSGHFTVTARSNSIELKPHPHRMPLPDFEKPLLSYSKPVIQQYPKDIIAEEGERVVFVPKVSGSPEPTVAWYLNGGMVSSDYAIEVGDDGCLTFICVESKHAGIYRFTVSNNAGSVQGQVCLYVRSEGDTTDDQMNGISPPQVATVSVPVEDFGSYIEELHENNNRGFRDQYYSLPSGEEGHETKWALTPENKPLNRFTNIVAYDDNRVKLKPLAGRADCQHEYINASYMDGFFTPKKFIATQGPIDTSIVDFWRLVWQVHPPVVVMITNLKEGTRAKCVQYWPEEKGQSSEYGPFKVTFSEEKNFADFTIRTFVVMLTTKSQTPLKITQFNYTSWPDHGVPDYVGPMLAFHRKIVAEYRPNKGPMLIHCSAGVGRTGTFLAIDIALEQVENDNSIDIPAIVSKLRTQRMKCVQTDEQYVFIHDAVFESLTCGNTQINGWELNTTVSRLGQVSPHTQRCGFQHQFEMLSKVTPKAGSFSSASAFQHPDKNRSMDRLPPERHRVILKAEYPDYIHASFVNAYKKKKAFIIAQGPLSNTCRDFWKMVYERNCSSIVMLSRTEEDGKEVCFRYWPESSNSQYGEFVVCAIEQTIHDGYIERVLGVTDSKSGQTHCISQFQLNDWYSVGCLSASPTQQNSLLSVIEHVLSLQKRNGAGPTVVHCSDTVGRSCVFCAVSILTECCKAEGLVDVFQIVKALRVQKPGAIPTVEQYQYIHDLLLTFVDSNEHSFGQL